MHVSQAIALVLACHWVNHKPNTIRNEVLTAIQLCLSICGLKSHKIIALPCYSNFTFRTGFCCGSIAGMIPSVLFH